MNNSDVACKEIKTDRGTVVDIWHLKMPEVASFGFNYDMPVFCSILIKRDDPIDGWKGGNFIATCINMQTDGYGATEEEALHDMNVNVTNLVFKIFEHHKDDIDAAWDNVFNIWRSNPRSSKLWDAYNEMQIEKAKRGEYSLDSFAKTSFKMY